MPRNPIRTMTNWQYGADIAINACQVHSDELGCWQRCGEESLFVARQTMRHHFFGGETMKVQRMLIAMTALNMGLTIFLVAQLKRADADSIAPVLRGRELEIVDDRGRVRASIKLHAADPKYKWPDGRIGYPETVMLRLVDQNGRPEVKLGASV